MPITSRSPAGFGTGYGGSILGQDKNLAEGLLVKNALFVAKGETAQFVANSPAKLVNAGFEEYKGNRFLGFTTQTDPGVKTFSIPASLTPAKLRCALKTLANRQFQRRQPVAPRQMLQALKTRTRGAWLTYRRRFA